MATNFLKSIIEDMTRRIIEYIEREKKDRIILLIPTGTNRGNIIERLLKEIEDTNIYVYRELYEALQKLDPTRIKLIDEIFEKKPTLRPIIVPECTYSGIEIADKIVRTYNTEARKILFINTTAFIDTKQIEKIIDKKTINKLTLPFIPPINEKALIGKKGILIKLSELEKMKDIKKDILECIETISPWRELVESIGKEIKAAAIEVGVSETLFMATNIVTAIASPILLPFTIFSTGILRTLGEKLKGIWGKIVERISGRTADAIIELKNRTVFKNNIAPYMMQLHKLNMAIKKNMALYEPFIDWLATIHGMTAKEFLTYLNNISIIIAGKIPTIQQIESLVDEKIETVTKQLREKIEKIEKLVKYYEEIPSLIDLARTLEIPEAEHILVGELLADKWEKTWDAISQGKSIVIVGRKGTGRTILLYYLARNLLLKGKNVGTITDIDDIRNTHLQENTVLIMDNADNYALEKIIRNKTPATIITTTPRTLRETLRKMGRTELPKEFTKIYADTPPNVNKIVEAHLETFNITADEETKETLIEKTSAIPKFILHYSREHAEKKVEITYSNKHREYLETNILGTLTEEGRILALTALIATAKETTKIPREAPIRKLRTIGEDPELRANAEEQLRDLIEDILPQKEGEIIITEELNDILQGQVIRPELRSWILEARRLLQKIEMAVEKPKPRPKPEKLEKINTLRPIIDTILEKMTEGKTEPRKQIVEEITQKLKVGIPTILIGEPGVGKSVLALLVAKKEDALIVMIQKNPRGAPLEPDILELLGYPPVNTYQKVIRVLAKQLEYLYNTTVEPYEDNIISTLHRSKQIPTIIIDGLDETRDEEELIKIVDLIERLSGISKILITARAHTIAEKKLGILETEKIRVKPENPQQTKDIEKYLQKTLRETKEKAEAIKAISEAAKGIFLIASILTKMYNQEQINVGDIHEMAQEAAGRLERYYEAIIRRAFKTEEKIRFAKTILATISIMMEPISINMIHTAITHEDLYPEAKKRDIRQTLDKLGVLLRTASPQYTVIHETISHYATQEIEETLNMDPTEFEEIIIDRLMEKKDDKEIEEYLTNHATKHYLEIAKQQKQKGENQKANQTLQKTIEYVETTIAKEVATLDPDIVIDNVNNAILATEWIEGPSKTQKIDKMIRLATIKTKTPNPDLIPTRAYKILAIFEPQKALRLAQKITNTEKKAEVLIELLDNPQTMKQALKQLQKTPTTDQQKTEIVKKLIKNRKIIEAIQTTKTIKDSYYKAIALATIAEALATIDPGKAKQTIQEAIQTTKTIEVPSTELKTLEISTTRAIALAKIAEALATIDPEKAKQTIQEAIQTTKTMEESDYKAQTLITIAEALATIDPEKAKQTIQEAIQTTKTIKNSYAKAIALAKIAEALATIDPEKAKQTIQEAIQTTKTMEESDYKAQTLAKIAEALATIDPEKAKQTIQEAIQTTKTIKNSYAKAIALAKIAEAIKTLATIDPEKAKQTIQEAIQTTKTIERSGYKAQTLITIAEALATIDPEKAKQTIQEAIQTTKTIERSGYKAQTLITIAEALATIDPEKAKQTIQEAIQTTKTIERSGYKAQTLITIAEALATIDPEKAKQTIQEAIQTTKTIKNSYAKAIALAKIAEALATIDPEKAKQTIQEAIQTTKTIERSGYKAQTLITIAEALATIDPEKAKQTIQEAIQTTKTIERSGYKAQTLITIAEALATIDPEKAKQTIQEAIQTTKTMEESDYKAQTLAKIAEALATIDPEKAKQTIQEAIQTTKTIKDNYYKAQTLAKIAEAIKKLVALDPEKAKQTIEEAIQTTKTIERSGYKAQALAKIAEAIKKLAEKDPEKAKQICRMMIDFASLLGLDGFGIVLGLRFADVDLVGCVVRLFNVGLLGLALLYCRLVPCLDDPMYFVRFVDDFIL